MRSGSNYAHSLVRTGQCLDGSHERLAALFRLARQVCADGFPAEETRELTELYPHVPLGWVDDLRRELARRLDLPDGVLSRDRFSIHGCGPVGLHDDFFRYPSVYFVVVVAHPGRLGLVDAHSRATGHRVGEILLLDPRGKHALVPTGSTVEEHRYDSTHGPVHDEDRQFMFLDFDVRRPDLRARFRAAAQKPP